MKTYTQIFREMGIRKPEHDFETGDYLGFVGKRRRKRAYRNLISINGIIPPKPGKKDLFFLRKGRYPTTEECIQLAACVDFEMWVCNHDTVHNFDI